MIARSLRWKPSGAYSFLAALISGGLALGVVGTFLFRNPATGVWAVYAAPLYFVAFFLVAEMLVLAVILVRMPLRSANSGARILAVASLAALGGLGFGFVFWWCIEFETPPVWASAIAASGSGGLFGWYARRYELTPQLDRKESASQAAGTATRDEKTSADVLSSRAVRRGDPSNVSSD